MVTKVGAKCPFFSTSRFSEKCYNQSADDKNGRHGNEITCCAGFEYLLEIYWEKHTFLGIENHLNVSKSRIDILFDTRRSGSV